MINNSRLTGKRWKAGGRRNVSKICDREKNVHAVTRGRLSRASFTLIVVAVMSSKPPPAPPPNPFSFDDDDEEGWQDMPVVREDEFTSGLDEEDRKKYHYVPSAKQTAGTGIGGANATGNLIDVDDRGNEWRSKVDLEEGEYTRLRINEEDDADEVHLRTKYLFDEDKAMTPLSQMQATKNLLTEAQRIAYVGVCALTSREMSHSLKGVNRKELKAAIHNMELWAMKIMGRIYYHMELETQGGLFAMLNALGHAD